MSSSLNGWSRWEGLPSCGGQKGRLSPSRVAEASGFNWPKLPVGHSDVSGSQAGNVNGGRFWEVGRVRTVGKLSMQAISGSHSTWRAAMATTCTLCGPERTSANRTRCLASRFLFHIFCWS